MEIPADIGIANKQLTVNSISNHNSDHIKDRSATVDANENMLISTESGKNTAIKAWSKEGNIFTDVLQLAGLKISPENMKLIQALMAIGLPATKENLTKLNQSLKLMDNNLEKAIFFLKNDMKVSVKNSTTLKGYINKEIQLLHQIESLAQAIDDIDDVKLKTLLINKILVNDAPTQTKPNQIIPDISVIKSDIPNVHGTNTEPSQKLALTAEDPLTKTLPANESLKDIKKSVLPERILNELKNELVEFKTSLNIELKPEFNADKLQIIIDKVFSTHNFSNTKFAEEMIAKNEFISIAKEIFGVSSKEFLHIEKALKALEHTDINTNNLSIKAKIISRFTLKAEVTDPNEIDKILNELKNSILSIKKDLPENNPASIKIMNTAEDIIKNMDFLNNMKNSIYLQIPININNKQANVEFFVFKNKNKNKSVSKSQSALISLNLLSLGHLETYVQKNGNNITCQFRVENDYIEHIIKTNISSFTEKLKVINLQLVNCSYKKTEESFNITDKEPSLDDEMVVSKLDSKIGFFDSKA